MRLKAGAGHKQENAVNPFSIHRVRNILPIPCLVRRLSSILPAAVSLALPACSTDSKPDKPVVVATSDTVWNSIHSV